SVVRSLRAPEPGKAATPRAFKSACHLYRRLRAMPSSRAISDAGRLPLSSSCTASRLNSGLNRFRWPIRHLRGTCCPHFKVSVKPGPPQVLRSHIACRLLFTPHREVVVGALDCARRPRYLSTHFVHWNDARVGPTAAVERAHSDRARSGSTGLTRASFQPHTLVCATREHEARPSQPRARFS